MLGGNVPKNFNAQLQLLKDTEYDIFINIIIASSSTNTELHINTPNTSYCFETFLSFSEVCFNCRIISLVDHVQGHYEFPES